MFKFPILVAALNLAFFQVLTPPVLLFPKTTWENDLFQRTSQGFYFTFCYYLALSIYQVRCWIRILFDIERIVRILLGNAKATNQSDVCKIQ